MHNLRLNIASILGGIVFVGVGVAALRQADDLWNSGLFSLTIGLLLAAVLMAVRLPQPRRTFWIGFGLFGWGYLSLTLISPVESRLITTKALAYLEQPNVLFNRVNAIRASLNLDRMRAYNVTFDDVMKALQPSSSGVMPSPRRVASTTKMDSPVQLNPTPQTVEIVLPIPWRRNKPEQYGNIILKADPDGEILRLQDIAKVWLVSSFNEGTGAGAAENFIGIGHSLSALVIAWLGGVLSRRLINDLHKGRDTGTAWS